MRPGPHPHSRNPHRPSRPGRSRCSPSPRCGGFSGETSAPLMSARVFSMSERPPARRAGDILVCEKRTRAACRIIAHVADRRRGVARRVDPEAVGQSVQQQRPGGRRPPSRPRPPASAPRSGASRQPGSRAYRGSGLRRATRPSDCLRWIPGCGIRRAASSRVTGTVTCERRR